MNHQEEVAAPRSVVTVVDDDPGVRCSLKFSLEIEGFAVRTFGSASEVLDSSEVRRTQCFVIDHKMPGMNGLDLVSCLRARHILTPAVLITSQPDAELTRRAARAAIPIVEKPLLDNALIERVRAACAQGKSTKT
jgi:two-component system response regulator FixJ